MGWTGVFLRENESNFDFFNREFGGRLIAITEDKAEINAEEPTVLYGAISIGKEIKNVAIIGIVILVERQDENNIMYKEMTEEMGPHYYYCPKEIIEILTPIHVMEAKGIIRGESKQWAQTWRQKCLS